MSGFEVYNDDGHLQFSSDRTWMLRLVAKGLGTLGPAVSVSSTSAAIIDVPTGTQAPVIAIRCTAAVAPYQSQIQSDGSGRFFFNSNGQQGGKFAYYVFDGGPVAHSASGAGLEVYRADGTLCFSSNVGFFNVAAVLNGYGSTFQLIGGRSYAAMISAFSGFLHQEAISNDVTTRYEQTTGSIGAYVRSADGVAAVDSVGWQDAYDAPPHADIDMPIVPVYIIDVTSFGPIDGE